MKRILVTGGAGFIGSHTTDLLLAHDYEVVVFDNLTSGKLTHLNLFHPKLHVISGDVLDGDKLYKEMSRCDAVLHLAAIPSVPLSIENPLQTFHVNMQGFLTVLETLRALPKPLRLVYASSAAVYGPSLELPCRDDKPLISEPLSPYALEKMHNENYAALFAKLYGIESLGLRYFNVYGKRQPSNSGYSGVISAFLKNNEPIQLFGDGEQTRDFIHVSDVARANMLALESEVTGVLNIATGRPETLNNLIHYIEKIAERSLQIDPKPSREGDIRYSFALTETAEKKLGFVFKVPLEEGIRKQLE